jgi:hypothetical protein
MTVICIINLTEAFVSVLPNVDNITVEQLNLDTNFKRKFTILSCLFYNFFINQKLGYFSERCFLKCAFITSPNFSLSCQRYLLVLLFLDLLSCGTVFLCDRAYVSQRRLFVRYFFLHYNTLLGQKIFGVEIGSFDLDLILFEAKN